MNDNRLLVMDDDPEVAKFFAQVGEDLGYAVTRLDEPERFMQTVETVQPTVILLDLQIPGKDGIALLRDLAHSRVRPKVLIASGLDNRMVTTATELGLSMGVDIAGAFCKPIALDELELQLARLLVQRKIITADRLREGIIDGQLVVHYLPKATLKSPGRWVVDGAEALVRWEHPEYGLLYPGEFLHVAEDNGLIVELTDFVFRTALEQARIWKSKGLRMDLGLNLSAHFLADLEFPDRLLALIAEHDLDPSSITLELKETTSVEDPELTLDVLARLRVKSVNLCLDDFGTGSSSLTHLYRMPFSEVKLDNAFTRDMQTRDDARAFVEGLVYLAHKLKISTCAEGVEDESTLHMLEALGCDRVQGHFIGPAARARDVERTIVQWNEEGAKRAAG
ncbi:MAG TPA: EAL domain-containing response regulator [Gammaproteobacteria bacterium]